MQEQTGRDVSDGFSCSQFIPLSKIRSQIDIGGDDDEHEHDIGFGWEHHEKDLTCTAGATCWPLGLS